jgi:hypothetical protein
MRRDGKKYEMIMYVWLDTTIADKERGLHEYVIVKTELDLNNVTDDDVLGGIGSYGYTIISLIEQYGEVSLDIIAECIMEEEILRDANIIGYANSEEEAAEIVKTHIKESQIG